MDIRTAIDQFAVDLDGLSARAMDIQGRKPSVEDIGENLATLIEENGFEVQEH